jgi:hypothetical protein
MATAGIGRGEQVPALAGTPRLAARLAMARGAAERAAVYDAEGMVLAETSFAAPGFRRGPMSS